MQEEDDFTPDEMRWLNTMVELGKRNPTVSVDDIATALGITAAESEHLAMQFTIPLLIEFNRDGSLSLTHEGRELVEGRGSGASE